MLQLNYSCLVKKRKLQEKIDTIIEKEKKTKRKWIKTQVSNNKTLSLN